MSYTPEQLIALKAELDANAHPVTGAYNADHQTAADQLNALNIVGDIPTQEMLEYLYVNEKDNLALYGRIAAVAQSSVGDLLPLNGGVDVTLDFNHISSALTLISALRQSEGGNIDLGLAVTTKVLSNLAAGQGCRAINPGQKTALEALADDRQSRATALDLPRAAGGAVEKARALP